MDTLGEQLQKQVGKATLEEPNSIEFPDITDLELLSFARAPPSIRPSSLLFRQVRPGAWAVHITNPMGTGYIEVQPTSVSPPTHATSNGKFQILTSTRHPGPFHMRVYEQNGELYATWQNKIGTYVASFHGQGLNRPGLDVSGGFNFESD